MWDRVVEPQPAAPSTTLGDRLAAKAAASPLSDQLYVTHAPEKLTWTYTDLDKVVRAVAAGLMEHGYKKGTKLALWAGNDSEHVSAKRRPPP